MGVVDDIIDRIQEIATALINDAIEALLKIVISGYTLVMSSPAIALASMFNDDVGWVDPLLLPGLVVTTQKFDLLDTNPLAMEAYVSEFSIPDLGGLLCNYRAFTMDDIDTGLICTAGDFAI